ncbi:MAG TPA: TetR/AcrR family transcriptional regulator [Kofleriaceae bacterium]|nr:TetR/AcrR family transcriptional regulator [Kofleriaceae bacterium]
MTVHSPGGKPGGDDRAGKRERILDAAERVFALRGFFTAKVADIAREAGVADGTIYLYFKSKDDLLISLFESRIVRVNELLAAAVASAARPRDKLTAFVRAYLQLIADQPLSAEVLTIELRQSTKFMREYSAHRFGELLGILAGVIAEGQAQGELSDTVPAQVAARMIWGMLDELALAWLLGRADRGKRGKKSLPNGVVGADDTGKKFDIVRAADWVGALVTQGLERRSNA